MSDREPQTAVSGGIVRPVQSCSDSRDLNVSSRLRWHWAVSLRTKHIVLYRPSRSITEKMNRYKSKKYTLQVHTQMPIFVIRKKNFL